MRDFMPPSSSSYPSTAPRRRQDRCQRSARGAPAGPSGEARRLDSPVGHAQYGPVNFGFALSGRGPLARPDALVKLAEAAEALRYSSIFTLRIPLDLASRRARPAAGDRTPFTGTSAEVIQDIRAYQALGVTHFVFDGVAP